ncbi:MAG: hypothetical protein ABL961_13180 [Vicinamibacterales bacterium]
MADPVAVSALVRDLVSIFADRLRALVTHGDTARTAGAPIASLAIVDQLTTADLHACAARVGSWHKSGVATPLLMGGREFEQSLDAFPLEFGAILSDYTVVFGPDPLQGLAIDPADLRRACEVQARSHLLHLREAFIETQGRPREVAALVQRSAAPLSALLRHIARQSGATPVDAVLARVAQLSPDTAVPTSTALSLFAEYVAALEHLTSLIDRWDSA